MIKDYRLILIICLIFSLKSLSGIANSDPWAYGTKLPGSGKWASRDRRNIYEWDFEEFKRRESLGKVYTVGYPVSATGPLFPYRVFQEVFNEKSRHPVKKFIYKIAKLGTGFKTSNDFYEWLGLTPYPENSYQDYSHIPDTYEKSKGLPMGVQLIERYGVEGVTIGCANCHSTELFGRKIIGLTSRFPQGNDLFHKASKLVHFANSNLIGLTMGMTAEETKMLKDMIYDLKWVKSKEPLHPSLDTSLSQVGASLHYRVKNEYADRKRQWLLRKHPLEYTPADSKPAVWWNLKYKNRWLSDGSVLSGNPVVTNFLWNEIGRGTDIRKLSIWFNESKELLKNLTTAIFNLKPPYYLDFFPVGSIDIKKAKRGEKLFVQNCQKCHGVYEKNWSLAESESMNKYTQIQTAKVSYHRDTPVIDVGTDPNRYLGMKTFYKDLNRLKVSKDFGVLIRPQTGYVPPPLVGIWARWPYFHNNSIPNLCALLTPGEKRPKGFWTGHAKDPETDFDSKCNGYPLKNVPASWKEKANFYYDTEVAGRLNVGHDVKILLDENGNEKFSEIQKLEIIEFLKTL